MKPKKSKIYYVSTNLFPSSQVETIQMMRMCEGLKEADYEPILIGRSGINRNKTSFTTNADIHEYYGIKTIFDLNIIRFPLIENLPRPMRILSFFCFALLLLFKIRKKGTGLIYTRDIYIMIVASLLKIKIRMIIEEHAPPLKLSHTFIKKFIYRQKFIAGIVFISEKLRNIYIAMGLLTGTRARIVVEHDAAAQSQINENRKNQNKKHVSDSHQMRVGYVGSLLPGRGIDLILKTAVKLSELEFYIVGGTTFQIDQFRINAPRNVRWVGNKPPFEVIKELNEFDILLMPYQNNTKTHGGVSSSKWMSPLKMFEYMASGVPIIASDLQVLREVLMSEQNCLLAAPMDSEKWVGAIELLVGDANLRNQLALQALKDVQERYNWKTRSLIIMNALRS